MIPNEHNTFPHGRWSPPAKKNKNSAHEPSVPEEQLKRQIFDELQAAIEREHKEHEQVKRDAP